MKKIIEFGKKHKKTTIVLVGILLLVLVRVSVAAFSKNRAKSEEAIVEKVILERRDLYQNVSATGKIVSAMEKQVNVTAANGLKIVKMELEVGDRVMAGDLLAVFDTEEIEQQISDVRKQINVEKGQAGLSVSNYQRSLGEAQTSQAIGFDRSKEAVDKAYAKYNTALGEVAEAERKLEEVKDTYGDYYDEEEYYNLKEELAAAEKRLADYGVLPKEPSTEGFEAAAGDFKSYIDTTEGLTSRDIMSNLVAPDANLPDKLEDYAEYDPLSVGETVLQIAAEKLERLLAANTDFWKKTKEASAAEEAYTELKNQAAVLSAKVSTMSTAGNAIEAAGNAVVSAQAAAGSMLEALEAAKDGFDDTDRKGAGSVADAESALKSADLTASTAGMGNERQIKSLEAALEGCNVVAPISGVITAVNYSQGDDYSAAAPLLVIEDDSSMDIVAYIDEYEINKIAPGQRVVFRTNGTGDEELEGVVKDVSPRASAAQGSADTSVKYMVRINIISDISGLRMDMTAKLNIITEEVRDVLAVPGEMVITNEEGSFVIGGDGTHIPVVVGREIDYYTEISGKGLSEGMELQVPIQELDLTDIDAISIKVGPAGGM